MNRKRLALIAALVGVALFLGGYLASPWIAVNNLRNAARAGDADRLQRLVDFPSVRDSLKGQLNALFMGELNNDPDLKNNPFAGFAAVLAPGLVNSAVDVFVTPDAISRLIEEGKAAPLRTPLSPRNEPQPVADRREAEVHGGYTDLDTFRVWSRAPDASPADEAALVLLRQGLFAWRLVRIELPPSLTRAPPA